MQLSAKPEITELLDILDKEGLIKEKDEVNSLISYFDDMECHFDKVLNELKEVRGELKKIQDKGLKAAVKRVVDKVETKIQASKNNLNTIKENFIASAKSAVNKFKTYGKSAFLKAVKSLKIDNYLNLLNFKFGGIKDGIAKEANKIAIIQQELSSVKEHTKNIGRTLIGRNIKQPKQMNKDKGILAGLQKLLNSVSKIFGKMELATDKMIDSLQIEPEPVRNDKQELPEKKSVKVQLQRIKSELPANRQLKPVKINEKSRQ